MAVQLRSAGGHKEGWATLASSQTKVLGVHEQAICGHPLP